MKLHRVLFLASLLVLAAFSSKLQAQNDDARMMVHLLDYIAGDYPGAVQNGKVVSESEFKEMQEFSQNVSKLSEKTPDSIKVKIADLIKLIDQKASSEVIDSVASGIKGKIVAAYQLQVSPKVWPDLENGRKLFALNCASCHGPNGEGNGPLAKTLDPPPANFHDPEKANSLSPFQAYNTIRLGVQNTGMLPFHKLNDAQVWDLAFYVLCLKFQGEKVNPEIAHKQVPRDIDLKTLAAHSNEELVEQYDLQNKPSMVAALRLYPRKVAEQEKKDYLDKAKIMITQATEAYERGDVERAKSLALSAYLDGVEPVEARLRANDAAFVGQLEGTMAEMRGAIGHHEDVEIIKKHSQQSIAMLSQAQEVIKDKSFNGWLAFLVSATIILREGLEAFLVIITILGVIRAMKLPKAAAWVHGGWIFAIGLGVVLWMMADRFFTVTGAQRELMEGGTAIFAVAVLLYVGFWMHSKSEAGKWQAYVKNKINKLATRESMWGLAFLSFLVVFREAFESVLFLSTLSLEVGKSNQTAFGMGVVAAFVALGLISVILLKFSRKIPVAKLFKYSSWIIAVLTVVITGKGMHALQEAGKVSISIMPFNFRWELIGFYPTWETFLSQVVVIVLIVVFWKLGNRQIKREKAVEPAPAPQPQQA